MFQGQRSPGIHAWWLFGRSFQTETIDLRLQNMRDSYARNTLDPSLRSNVLINLADQGM